jgi:hypothetical protein
MDNISKHIKKIYVQTDYFSKYGPDVLVSLLIILFFSVLIIYFLLKSSLGDIKEKLKKNRCDAKYIFFSGWVSKKENQTPLMATAENMTICLNDLIYSVFIVFLEPVLSMTQNIFTQNFMQVGLSGVTSTQASTLSMININLHVGMKLFQEHLKVLFVPIIKLNHVINDSLEKFVLILNVVINALEVHRHNIKYILLSMYNSLLKISLKGGKKGKSKMNKGYKKVIKSYDKYNDIQIDPTDSYNKRVKDFKSKRGAYKKMLNGWSRIQDGYSKLSHAARENKKPTNKLRKALEEIYNNEEEIVKIKSMSGVSDKLQNINIDADDKFISVKANYDFLRNTKSRKQDIFNPDYTPTQTQAATAARQASSIGGIAPN